MTWMGPALQSVIQRDLGLFCSSECGRGREFHMSPGALVHNILQSQGDHGNHQGTSNTLSP